MSIGMTIFKELYGYGVVSFMDLILSNSRALRARDSIQKSLDIVKALKEILQ